MSARTPPFYRRNLPHIHPIGACFFVTWRLHDSLPKAVWEQLQEERRKALADGSRKDCSPAEYQKLKEHADWEYQQKIEAYLDAGTTGPHFLREAVVAQIVERQIREFDGRYYRLYAFCIMSNHIHAVLDFSFQVEQAGENFVEAQYVQLAHVMKLLKGSTGFDANRFLGRSGSFWARESYDRYIRDDAHLKATLRYVLRNPVKANLCQDWREHPFTWILPEWAQDF